MPFVQLMAVLPLRDVACSLRVPSNPNGLKYNKDENETVIAHKVNNIRGMALESQEEFDAALGDGSKADTVRKAFIKLRGELTHLYQMQCSLRTAAQSDSETALVDDLLADLEKISRKAHEQTHFTYTTLEEIAALN